MAITVYEAILATDHQLDVYGGITIPRSVLEGLAQRMKIDPPPLTIEHNPRYRIPYKVLDAGVREGEDGHLEVWVRYEIDDSHRAAFERLTGLSITVAEPATTAKTGEEAWGIARLYADAGHFSDEVLAEAVGRLAPHFDVSANRLYQFALTPPAQIIIELAGTVLSNVPASLIASVLYDALRPSILRPETPQVNKYLVRLKTETASATMTSEVYFEAASDEAYKAALESLPKVIPTSGRWRFDPDRGDWDAID